MNVVGTSSSELLRRLESGVARLADEVEEARLADSADAHATGTATERTQLLGMLLAGVRPGYLAEAGRPGVVGYGARVVLEDLVDGSLQTHQVMGSEAMDIDQGHVSIESPLGRALLGRGTDEVVEVRVPAGVRRYRIVEVHSLGEILDEIEAEGAATPGSHG